MLYYYCMIRRQGVEGRGVDQGCVLPNFRRAATSHLLIIRPSGDDLVTTMGSNSGEIVYEDVLERG